MVHAEIDTQLVLLSARKSRGAGHWDKHDYDVRLGDGSGPVVGRIMRHPQAPDDQPLDDNRTGATTLGLQSRLRSEPPTSNAIF